MTLYILMYHTLETTTSTFMYLVTACNNSQDETKKNDVSDGTLIL